MPDLSITIRVMPNGDDIEVVVPSHATATDVIEKMVGEPSLGIPRIDQQGNPIAYRLGIKGRRDETLDDDQTLESASVQNSDILLMMPTVIAGSHS